MDYQCLRTCAICAAPASITRSFWDFVMVLHNLTMSGAEGQTDHYDGKELIQTLLIGWLGLGFEWGP